MLPHFQNKEELSYSLLLVGQKQERAVTQPSQRTRMRQNPRQRKLRPANGVLFQLGLFLPCLFHRRRSEEVTQVTAVYPVSTDASCNGLTLLTIYCRGEVVLGEELRWYISRNGDRRVIGRVRVLKEVWVVTQIRGQVMGWRHG